MANILITGASSGLGEGLAYFYASKKNTTLFISGRNQDRLNNVAKKCIDLGATVHANVIDVTKKEAMQEWITQCHLQAKLNLVIANAGVSTDNDECCDAMYNTININVVGVLNTILPVLDIYKTQKYKNKQIAIISSIAGYFPMAQCPAYSASKNCVKTLGLAFRERYKKHGIKINVICPGFIRSRITDKNTCPMPLFMETDIAAQKIADRLERNQGLISFPFAFRFVAWFISSLPYCISSFLMSLLPNKN